MAAKSPHTDCMEHSGIKQQLAILIAIGLLSMGIQAYAVKVNAETREEMARFGGKVAVLEMRVTNIEKLVGDRDRLAWRRED